MRNRIAEAYGKKTQGETGIHPFVSDRVIKAMQAQVAHEAHNALLYENIASYFDVSGLLSLAAFFRKQSCDETGHSKKFSTYIQDVGFMLETPALESSDQKYTSAAQAIQTAYEIELTTTEKIHDLMKLAREDNDYASEEMLWWFVKEQVEELDTISTLLDIVKSSGSLVMADMWTKEHLPG
jgi:ferritin